MKNWKKSMIERKAIKNKELNQIAENVDNLKDALVYVKEDKKLIWSKKQNITNLAYRHGCILQMFKESKTFIYMVIKLKISMGVITFKIKLYKLLKKFPVLQKSMKLTFYFKNYFCQIKLICNTIRNEFKHLLLA